MEKLNILKCSLIFFTLLLYSKSTAQKCKQYINKNAVCVSNTTKTYTLLNEYDIVMVGEIHGTTEPAELVLDLANVFIANNEKVIIGIEAKTSEFELFIENPNEENLKKSTFFTRENVDGRNGLAWYNLILKSLEKKSIKLFFFDIEDYAQYEIRDSLMARNIYNKYNEFSDYKMITLSGNLHNTLIPKYENIKSTYNFLEKNDGIKIGTIAHTFHEGSALVNRGNGLETYTFAPKETIFSKSKMDCSFLVFNNKNKSKKYYTFRYYTPKITSSIRLSK